MTPSISINNGTSVVPPNKRERRGMGIALRIALLAWIAAMATLVIFIFVTMPQQKKMFLRQLESKANSVSLSLHDVAAGAAVNEDYASVISSAQTMLMGDATLDFLLVMKNDGFSLIIEQDGWRVEQQADSYWLDRERKTASTIKTVPLFERRVFHYAKPFDYSGIQWGWIHVGLSLDEYDKSVASLYRNTIVLAIGCIVFSLLVSLGYARQVVRPILRLRSVVQEIADGDLSVRAKWVRRDEIGSLSNSVNTMAEALLRRDRILESVRFAAQQFMRYSRWENSIPEVLTKLGLAAEVSRATVIENHESKDNRLLCSLRFTWMAEGIDTTLKKKDLQKVPFTKYGLDSWQSKLEKNEIVVATVSDVPAGERELFDIQNIFSIILIPVFVEEQWWGVLGLSDCKRERIWTNAEKDSLRAAADMFGATIARQRVQDALVEAKATLEQRVEERTQELRTQVAAKESALTELAEAQSSLVEVSRAAGMAEVATGVLHNVGNILNSVNVSCNLLLDQLRESRVGNLAKVADLITENESETIRFFTEDPRGRKIPTYLVSLASALGEEHQMMRNETEALQARIEHIKEIVAMQQSYGRVSGVSETLSPEQLMEDALKLNIGALTRHNVTVQRQYESVPAITVDKHAVLQILLNLINNAKYACTDNDREDKIMTLKTLNHSSGRVHMQVEDNGIGIPQENLTKIFQHGFTTRKTGHGFGLHSGALAARELGGSLSVHSDGPGLGATFTLELPCRSGENI